MPPRPHRWTRRGDMVAKVQVVAIAMNAEPWPPMASTDAVMSQLRSVAGMPYFTSRDTESSHRSIRSCATACDQTCVRGRPGNVGAESDRQADRRDDRALRLRHNDPGEIHLRAAWKPKSKQLKGATNRLELIGDSNDLVRWARCTGGVEIDRPHARFGA